MQSVINLTGNVYSLADAAKLGKSGGTTWRCAVCQGRVFLRQAFGRLRMDHVVSGCDGVLSNPQTLVTAKRLHALLRQNWTISASTEDAAGTVLGSALIPIERATPFTMPEFDVPMVLVQSYWTVFLVGIVSTEDHVATLTAAAQSLGCGALAVPTADTSWAMLGEILLTPDAHTSVWVAPVEQERVDGKRARFDSLATKSTSVSVHENRKAEHYDPKTPNTATQYREDIESELAAQRWSKWVHSLVKSEEDGYLSDEWFDTYPAQVPHFWLRFWLIKHSLFALGRLIDPALLAIELASNWDADAESELTTDLAKKFGELLAQLENTGVVESRKGQFFCKRAFR